MRGACGLVLSGSRETKVTTAEESTVTATFLWLSIHAIIKPWYRDHNSAAVTEHITRFRQKKCWWRLWGMSCSHTGLAIGQSLRMCRQFSTGNPQLLHEQSVVKCLVRRTLFVNNLSCLASQKQCFSLGGIFPFQRLAHSASSSQLASSSKRSYAAFEWNLPLLDPFQLIVSGQLSSVDIWMARIHLITSSGNQWENLS